ncbi:helix-turn-helix transcriptional regulator [Rhizobium sp. RU35A]|uniref:XRE family transcriptional regulator n=1 Tax=Rhizobium sp. RU35A TaxID=1907414 RepID=UPI001FCEB3B2|nr:helix-turn-helix transcriptional regulator [Rhizobium sp. RU35A]
MKKEQKTTGKPVPTTVEGYSSDFGSRISLAIDRIGTQARAGEIAGVTDEQIARWRDGFSKPNFFGIARIARAAGLSVDWLATGEGVQEAASGADFKAELPDGRSMVVQAKTTGPEGFALIPRLDIQASAGNGRLAVHEEPLEYLAFQADWLRSRGINPASARILTARGDSMEETIRDGDVLLVDTSIDRVRDNSIYVVVYGDMVLVKRIHGRINGSLQLISDNPRYPPEEVSAGEVEQLNIAGRVMWFGRSI